MRKSLSLSLAVLSSLLVLRCNTAPEDRVLGAPPEVVSGDGQKIYRNRIDLADTESFGSRTIRIPVDLTDSRRWVRVEVWDVAANGAFTQPVWIE